MMGFFARMTQTIREQVNSNLVQRHLLPSDHDLSLQAIGEHDVDSASAEHTVTCREVQKLGTLGEFEVLEEVRAR